MARMQVAVVGAGVMGCAAARALAAGGHQVQLYEQYEPGNDRGSSHGRSRIVRLAYPQPEWVRLAEQAIRGWRELEAECGERLLQLHGLLELTAGPGSSSAAALAAAGAPFEPLTAAQVGARWPVAAPVGWTVLHQPDAGIVRADLALRALLAGALRRGARLRQARVTSVDAVDADVVVVTAGSWVRRLLPDLPVRVTRETVAYFRRAGAPLPAVVSIDAGGQLMYSLHDPVHGLKAGVHHAGRDADPEDGGGPDPDLVDRIASWVHATHPDADPRPVAAQACLYTTTADEGFILQRRGRVVIGSACSGHGFKFAPVVGRLLADRVAALAP
jgi:sarcosine oxidase